MINQFLDNGGSITFMMPPNDEKMEYTNIGDVMSKYSIVMNYDRVKETDENYLVDGDNPYLLKLICLVLLQNPLSILHLKFYK